MITDLAIRYLIQPFRPRVGWVRALFGLTAALCPPLAASYAALSLPVGAFFWAALLGFLLGLRSAPDARRADERPMLAPARWSIIGIVSILGVTLLVLSVDGALPPLAIVLHDVNELGGWPLRALHRTADLPAPDIRSRAFLAQSLPRFWSDLVMAPDAGQRGAQLMVSVGGVVLTWIGALLLGYALLKGHALLLWELPLLAALLLTTILGGSTVLPLIGGLGLLLVLAVQGEFQWREREWERSGTDFSGELRIDVLFWGGVTVLAVLLLAALLPAWPENPLAHALWSDVTPPSGLAALERDVQLARRQPAAPVGISNLPALNLGVSLEQGPPEQPALRIQLDTPLPESSWPHYWRVRMFNLYTGRGWTTDARVSQQEPIRFAGEPLQGLIVQTIDDARKDRAILAALPDVIGVDMPVAAERLSDGALTAMTAQRPSARYRVLSRPQEFAAPPPPDGPAPDPGPYLGLPQDLPPRVRELARAIAGPGEPAYRQALELEAYLRELPYAYRVQPIPAQGDAVTQFLFEMRQGYCTYYASAMAVMARSLGIPARIAIGYASGRYDATHGVYIVTESDAHAWPELYIDGRWMPFEPTPVRLLPARAQRDQPSIPPAPPTPQIAPAQGPGPLIWLSVIIMLSVAAAAGVWFGRRGWRLTSRLPPAIQVQQQLERLGLRAGVEWPRGATLQEYGRLLTPYLRGTADALAALVALIERARYGGRALTADEERRLRAAWRRVREGLKRYG